MVYPFSSSLRVTVDLENFNFLNNRRKNNKSKNPVTRTIQLSHESLPTREKAGRETQGEQQLQGQNSGPRLPKILCYCGCRRWTRHFLPLPLPLSLFAPAPPWAILSENSREAELKRKKILEQTMTPTSWLSEREEGEDDYVWEQDFQIYNSLEEPSATASTQSSADLSVGESSRSSPTVSFRGGRHALVAEK